MKKDYPVEVEWRPFELRPGTPPEGAPLPEHYRQTEGLSEAVQRMADDAGLAMKRPSLISNSRPALEAAEFAKDHGRFDEYHLGLFKAYWEEGKDIGSSQVLQEVAVAAGLDGDKLMASLEAGQYVESVTDQVEEAQAMGISAIPAFIVGRYYFMGAQPYEIFQRVMAQAQEKEEPPQPS